MRSQIAMQHVFQEQLGFDLRRIPVSNVIFSRSGEYADLSNPHQLAEDCRPFHQAVIDDLDIQSINPVVRVRTVDATAFNTLGLSGTAQGDTDSLIYLKAVDQNGTRKADNASEHIKIAVDAGTIEVTELAATVPEPFGSEVLIQTTYDGTNLPLAITTGQQIS